MFLAHRSDLEISSLRAAAREHRVLAVKSFFELDSAEVACQLLDGRVPWTIGGVDASRAPISVPSAAYEANQGVRNAFLSRAHGGSPTRFRYLYRSYHLMRFHREGKAAGHLGPIVRFLTSRVFERTVSEIFEIDVADVDAHLASYDPGHFLNRHSDAVDPRDGKRRAVAFVINLSPEWHSDWGGLTTFWPRPDEPGETYTPEFNSALLFRVPVDHSVGIVAQSAPSRLSIAGWLHATA